MNRIFGSAVEMNDALDESGFDPIQFINSSFPTESSLEDLDTFVVGVNTTRSHTTDFTYAGVPVSNVEIQIEGSTAACEVNTFFLYSAEVLIDLAGNAKLARGIGA